MLTLILGCTALAGDTFTSRHGPHLDEPTADDGPRYECFAVVLNTGLGMDNARANWSVTLPAGYEPVGGGGNPASVIACRVK